jgi:regulator of extracellular matrix RemA (YlzA/DUF370 family)
MDISFGVLFGSKKMVSIICSESAAISRCTPTKIMMTSEVSKDATHTAEAIRRTALRREKVLVRISIEAYNGITEGKEITSNIHRTS